MTCVSLDVHITESKLIVPSKSVIESDSEKDAIYERLVLSWTGRRHVSVLGCNPVSMSRSVLPSLTPDHMVALKSDGVRYTLYLFMRGSNPPSPAGVMIDRAKNMYEVEAIASEDFFTKETILEGELVVRQPSETAFMFVVFDVVKVKGEVVTSLPFKERIDIVYRLTRLSEEISSIQDAEDMEDRVVETDTILLVSQSLPITMRPKQFVSVVHADVVWENRRESLHRVDGLVIADGRASYKNGSAGRTMYKWKPYHTVDLRREGQTLFHSTGELRASSFENRKIRVMQSRVTTENDQVAEYNVDVSCKSEVRLFAMRTRPDKLNPNSLPVVEATFRDALENILPSEIASVADPDNMSN